MQTKIIIALLVSLTAGAIGVATMLYMKQSGTTPLSTPGTITPTPQATTSELPSPSSSPRVYSAAQALAVPSGLITLQAGESLFSIAKAHGLTVDQMAKINSIPNADTVIAGQSLILPDSVSSDTYTILFIRNTNRLAKEEQKIAEGAASLYADPITAAQTDTKDIYGLTSDMPYALANPNATSSETTTVSGSDADKAVTITLEKTKSNLWVVKKLVIKITPKDMP